MGDRHSANRRPQQELGHRAPTNVERPTTTGAHAAHSEPSVSGQRSRRDPSERLHGTGNLTGSEPPRSQPSRRRHDRVEPDSKSVVRMDRQQHTSDYGCAWEWTADPPERPWMPASALSAPDETAAAPTLGSLNRADDRSKLRAMPSSAAAALLAHHRALSLFVFPRLAGSPPKARVASHLTPLSRHSSAKTLARPSRAQSIAKACREQLRLRHALSIHCAYARRPAHMGFSFFLSPSIFFSYGDA